MHPESLLSSIEYLCPHDPTVSKAKADFALKEINFKSNVSGYLESGADDFLCPGCVCAGLIL
jgi:hypothetical protein